MSNTRLSKSNMTAKIASALSTTAGKITAARHRDLEAATLDYTAFQIISSGYYLFGDAVTGGSTKTVSLGKTLSTLDYEIFGTMVSIGSSWNNDNDAIFTIINKTLTTFDLRLGDINSQYQNITFSWMAVHVGNSDIAIT